MTISELQKFLAATKRKHGDIEVLMTRYSDYDHVVEANFEVKKAVDKGSEWVTRFHDTMTEEDQLKAKTYFIMPGN